MDYKDYLCIHKEKELIKNCKTCCGITDFCGLYKNKLGINPEFHKLERTKIIKLVPKKKLTNILKEQTAQKQNQGFLLLK